MPDLHSMYYFKGRNPLGAMDRYEGSENAGTNWNHLSLACLPPIVFLGNKITELLRASAMVWRPHLIEKPHLSKRKTKLEFSS